MSTASDAIMYHRLVPDGSLIPASEEFIVVTIVMN